MIIHSMARKKKEKPKEKDSLEPESQHEELFVPFRRLQAELFLRLAQRDSKKEIRVLDIGAGEGRLAELILENYPKSQVVCIDRNEETVRRGARRLRSYGGRVQYILADIAQPEWTSELHKTFHLTVSAYTMHHIEDDRKKRVYRRIYEVLEPEGAFFLMDRVAVPSQQARARYEAIREEHVRQQLETRLTRKLPSEAFHELFSALPCSEKHRPAPLDLQLQWLDQIGFRDVDCYWKFLDFALFGGLK